MDNDRFVLRVPWKKTPMKRRRDIIVPACVSPHDRRPIRAETRATLVASIARGRRWLDEIVAGTVTSVEQIAARDKCSIRQVNMTISLAFLAPDLVKAAVQGRLPRGIGVARLRDAPAEWSRQRKPPQSAHYSSETRKRRFVSECVVGLEGLEPLTRSL
jgi:site-specific DNA recombinase